MAVVRYDILGVLIHACFELVMCMINGNITFRRVLWTNLMINYANIH